MKQIIKHKTVGKAFSSTENTKENASDMHGLTRWTKILRVRQKILAQFYPRIIFWGDSFSRQVWQCETMDALPEISYSVHKTWKRYSITDTLNQLKCQTLEERRKCARLTSLYKVPHNLIYIPEYYLPQASTSRTRGHHKFKFLHYQTNNDTYNTLFPKNYTWLE